MNLRLFLCPLGVVFLCGCFTAGPVTADAIVRLPISTNSVVVEARDPEIREAVGIINSCLAAEGFTASPDQIRRDRVEVAYKGSLFYPDIGVRLFTRCFDHPSMFANVKVGIWPRRNRKDGSKVVAVYVGARGPHFNPPAAPQRVRDDIFQELSARFGPERMLSWNSGTFRQRVK